MKRQNLVYIVFTKSIMISNSSLLLKYISLVISIEWIAKEKVHLLSFFIPLIQIRTSTIKKAGSGLYDS
jgi:hypothetical protein